MVIRSTDLWLWLKELDFPATECENLFIQNEDSAVIKNIVGYYCRRDLYIKKIRKLWDSHKETNIAFFRAYLIILKALPAII